MKIKGSILGIFRNAVTGEVTKTITKDNHIQKVLFKNIYGKSDGNMVSNLFASSYNHGSQSDLFKTGDIPNARSSTNIPGVAAKSTEIEALPGIHVYQVARRLTAPGVATEIRTVGLCSGVSSGKVTSPQAVVWLSETVIQEADEILDVYYRVQTTSPTDKEKNLLDLGAAGFSPAESRALAVGIAGAELGKSNEDPGWIYRTYSHRGAFSFSSLPQFNYRASDYCSVPSVYADSGSHPSQAYESKYYKASYTTDITKFMGSVGNAVGWMAPTRNLGPLLMQKVGNDNGYVQSVFGHHQDATGPFYSALTTPQGGGSIDINADGWTTPELGRHLCAKITKDGGVGVGEYRINYMPWFGFDGNSFSNQLPVIPSSYYENRHFSGGFAICRDDRRGKTATPQELAAVCQYKKSRKMFSPMFIWKNEFAIINLTTGLTDFGPFTNTTMWPGDSSPRFLASDIRQICESTSGYTYVSCGNTGLYRFNSDFTVMDKLDSSTTGLSGTSGCYAVTEGFGGRIWAFFGHSSAPTIYYTDDNGDNWTATTFSTALTTSSPEVVVALQSDITSADGRLALMHFDVPKDGVSVQNLKHTWWDHLNSTATECTAILRQVAANGTCDNLSYAQDYHNYYWEDVLSCAPDGSVWICHSQGTSGGGINRWTFGQDTFVNHVGRSNLVSVMNTVEWVEDSDGSFKFIWVSKDSKDSSNGGGLEGSLVATTLIVSTDGTFVSNPASRYNGGNLPHRRWYLGHGIWLSWRLAGSGALNERSMVRGGSSNRLSLESHYQGLTNRFLPGGISDDFYDHIVSAGYGWDGAKWVLGHPGSKVIHSDHQELLDGVTISFSDNSGSTPFYATDHYSTQLFDGLVMDGVTSWSKKISRYVKPAEALTDVESSTLPATQKISNIHVPFFSTSDADYQDLDSMNTDNLANKLLGTGNGLLDAYTGRARSAAPVISGALIAALPNKCFAPNSDIVDATGWSEIIPYFDPEEHIQAYIGLCPASFLGTTIDVNAMPYAFKIDSYQGGAGTLGLARVSVVEGGQERAVLDDFPINIGTQEKLRIVLRNSGQMEYQYTLGVVDEWETLYVTPGIGQVPLVDYYLDVAMVPLSNYGFHVTHNSLSVSLSDYYLYLGNDVDSGLFDPKFEISDPEYCKVIIDGVEAVQVGLDDYDTVLEADNYVFFPDSCVIRYSAADVGKSVSAEYLVIKDY